MHDNAIIAILLAVFTGLILLGTIYAMRRRARLRRDLRVKHAQRHILNWNRSTCPQNPPAGAAGSKKPAASKKGENALAKSAPKAPPSVARPKSVPIHVPSHATQKPPSAQSESKRGSQAGLAKRDTVQEWLVRDDTSADGKSQQLQGGWEPQDGFAKGGGSSQKGQKEKPAAIQDEWPAPNDTPSDGKSQQQQEGGWKPHDAPGKKGNTNQKAEKPKEQRSEMNSAALQEMRDNDDAW